MARDIATLVFISYSRSFVRDAELVRDRVAHLVFAEDMAAGESPDRPSDAGEIGGAERLLAPPRHTNARRVERDPIVRCDIPSQKEDAQNFTISLTPRSPDTLLFTDPLRDSSFADPRLSQDFFSAIAKCNVLCVIIYTDWIGAEKREPVAGPPRPLAFEDVQLVCQSQQTADRRRNQSRQFIHDRSREFQLETVDHFTFGAGLRPLVVEPEPGIARSRSNAAEPTYATLRMSTMKQLSDCIAGLTRAARPERLESLRSTLTSDHANPTDKDALTVDFRAYAVAPLLSSNFSLEKSPPTALTIDSILWKNLTARDGEACFATSPVIREVGDTTEAGPSGRLAWLQSLKERTMSTRRHLQARRLAIALEAAPDTLYGNVVMFPTSRIIRRRRKRAAVKLIKSASTLSLIRGNTETGVRCSMRSGGGSLLKNVSLRNFGANIEKLLSEPLPLPDRES